MFRSSTARTVIVAAVILIALGVLRYKPWQRSAAPGAGGQTAALPEGARPTLAVGFLPVT